NREPVFIEDLAVNGNDLIEIGIMEGIEIGKTLNLLLDTVHKAPENNERDRLLKMVRSRGNN
ncbi:MAG TPA: polynucleotide adenylyltransferase, partial [Anaerovoracaceae bacterium]|nr:polynucleotide adenylyltransferase [Anaerovoracaceae bacterium]